MLSPRDNCWRIESGAKASIIIDAEEYFRVARDAMLNAKRRVMLVGWDFDARITLVDDSADEGPTRLGPFITWLADRNPDLEFYLLRWDVGAIKSLFRGSTPFTVLNWMRRKNIHTKLDGAHPTGASHHQKIVVIDDCFAFCGGIDMTGDRWDTHLHRDDEPGRRRPNGKPYKPWHDATTALQGPVAAALGELCRDRWHRAGGMPIEAVDVECDYWPEGLPVQFTEAKIAIARTEPELSDHEPVHEIERLFLDQIASAKRFIYAESQYFASRRIAEAIDRRMEEEGGPEIVILNPQTSEGWLEPVAMDTARARLFQAIKRHDRDGRFRIYHPTTKQGEPIYCHAKILIVDDSTIRVGSSNMNNRSMRLDTECDVVVDAREPANGSCADTIAAVRNSLLGEHLGVEPEMVAAKFAATGSLIETIEALRGEGKTLQPYETPNLNDVEAWLADNEILDPEGPEEIFEAISKRGLFRRTWRRFRPPRG